MPKVLKAIPGTNIRVQRLVPLADSQQADPTQHIISLYESIEQDDTLERSWARTLRPARSLIHPAEAFAQGIKVLRPALVFSTFQADKAKARRLARREREQNVAKQRRAARMTPTAAMKATMNMKKVPRTGGQATAEETRILSRGSKAKKAKTAGGVKKQEKTKALGNMSEAELLAAEQRDASKERPKKKQRAEKIGTRL